MDVLTAPTVGGVLAALVDQGHPDVVLDLTDLAFIDAAGLRVIARISAQLAHKNSVLTVRGAPAHARRILDITGMSDFVRFAPTTTGRQPGRAAEPAWSGSTPSLVAAPTSLPAQREASDLATELARSASRPRTDAIDAALHEVTVLAGATVGAADGASITLERNGTLATAAASNLTVQRMDDHQYETGEGPCLSAAALGRWFHIESLADEHRWPAFVPLAREQGIASIFSSPLSTATGSCGALNIYSNTTSAFGPREQELALLFAAQASGILAGAEATDGADAEGRRRRITDALGARELIARAQGVLMAREGLGADAAAGLLHRSARAAGETVEQVAARMVASTGAGPADDETGPDR
jgi:anti-anti-sigma factor